MPVLWWYLKNSYVNILCLVVSRRQAFSDYQTQQMLSTFIDQFGFKEDEFSEQEERVEWVVSPPPTCPSLLPENCAALNKFTTEPLRYASRFSFFLVVNHHVIIDFSAPFSLFSSINFDIDKDSPVSSSFLHHLIVCVLVICINYCSKFHLVDCCFVCGAF